MEFKVHTPGGEQHQYHGRARYEIGASNAVLTVWDEEDEKITKFGPTAWLRIEQRFDS